MTGAVIGIAIISGVGTVVGGFIGIVVGAMGTTSSNGIKNACDKLSGQLDPVFFISRNVYNVNL